MALGSLVVGGKENLPDSDTSRTVASHIAIYNLDATLQCFWEVENVPLITHLTQKEEDYYNHFKASHTRNAKVRFVLRLPFKYPAHLEHPGMKGITKACLTRPESRFDHQPEVAELYRNFIAEYLQLNHIAKVPDDQVKRLFSSCIPHHPVFKRDNPKKIRGVFNASQKISKGVSLNLLLHVGPKL